MKNWANLIFEISEFELGEKLDHHFQVKFRDKSIDDNFNALKQYLNLKMAHIGARNRKI